MPTKLDMRRLNDGAKASRLLAQDPKTIDECRSQIEELSDAIAAMQSLDDLGSAEANQRAMDDMDALLARYQYLKTLRFK